MRSREAMQWESALKRVFDTIDAELEAEYGGRYPLNPVRPKRGDTANPEDDGLFNVGAAFSAGFGSTCGPGYVVDIRMATLKDVPAKIQDAIKANVLAGLKKRLPEAFPGKTLHVSEEDGIIRIHGDLSLDKDLKKYANKT